MYRIAAPAHRCVGRERAGEYSVHRRSVTAALAKINAGLEELAQADTASSSDEELRASALAASAAVSRLSAQETRLVGAVDRRDAYHADACARQWAG